MEVAIQTFVHGRDGGHDDLGSHPLDMNQMAETLNRYYRGFHQDLAGRTQDCWHPRIDDDACERPGIGALQSLNFMAKHICSMDRGFTGQWPKWSIERELVEMPLDQASRFHDPDNMPIVSLAPGHHPWEWQTPKALDMGTAYVERPVLDDVAKIGWAEVFWHICKACEFVDPDTLGLIFGVPMDWYRQMKSSPIDHTYMEAAMRGWAIR